MSQPRQFLIFALVGLLLVFGIYATYIGIVAYSWSAAAGEPMQLSDRPTWPLPIQDLALAMRAAGLDDSELEVYQLDPLPDERAIIRLPDSAASLEFLTEQLELTPIETLHPGTQEMIARLPEPWWIGPEQSGPFLASPRYLTGEDADQYVVARDEDRQQIFIFYYFDF